MRDVPIKRLAEIAESVRYGYTASASEAPVGPRFLRITDIVRSQIDWDKVPYCEIDERAKERFSLAQGDIVIARTGATVGYAKLIRDNPEAVFASYLVRVRVDPAIAEPGYVGRVVESEIYKKFVISRVGGAAQPNANAKVLSEFCLPIPDRATQNRIVEVLSAYDNLIENNRRRIQLLEQAARLLYKEWFVHLRFSGHEHVKIKDGVPEGWRRVPLQEVCTRITDGSHSSPPSVDEGLPMASVKDMHDWGFNTDQCRKISHQDFESLVRNDCKPLKNDVLIAKDGSYLKHTFVVQEEIDLVILSSIAILRPNPLIDPHLLNFILRDPSTKTRMTGYVSGAALPRIILKEFRNFQILLPPSDVQRFWAMHASPMAVQCHQIGKQNKVLAKARDLLLPRLMNGEIPV